MASLSAKIVDKILHKMQVDEVVKKIDVDDVVSGILHRIMFSVVGLLRRCTNTTAICEKR